VKLIEEQSQPNITNPRSEQLISVDVLGKRSGYLKGYGIHRSTYGTQSERVPNTEEVALKQQVADQGKLIANIMRMLANGINPATIPEIIQMSENEDITLDEQ
jgi:hypothetical protein